MCYKKYYPFCDKEIKNEDIIKRYKLYEKGKYVTFVPDEPEKRKTKKGNLRKKKKKGELHDGHEYSIRLGIVVCTI